MERVVTVPGAPWCAAVAGRWLELLDARPVARLCLATGSTPLPVYARIAEAHGALGAASVLLLDEFGDLPADEPESCDRVLRRSLIDPAGVADYRSISVGTPDLDGECRAVDGWIDTGPGGCLDLAVLGLGVNGHVGMNEPGSPVDGRTARVELAASTIASAQRYFEGRARPTWGVTVGLGDLLAAREVWVLATGRDKATIVARCFESPATAEVPASLLQDHPNCTWWLDKPSAGLT